MLEKTKRKKKKKILPLIFVRKRNLVLRDIILNMPRHILWPVTKKMLNIWCLQKWKRQRKSLFTFFTSHQHHKELAQKRMRLLRRKKKSRLAFSFFQGWKKIIPPLTRKQHVLKRNYHQYKHLRIKDRMDFFRSYIGKTMLLTEIHSQNNYKNTWFSREQVGWKTHNLEYKWTFRREYDEEKSWLSLWERNFLFAKAYKESWWYENLIQKKPEPQSARVFVLNRPNTAFQIHWKQQKKEPWKNALLFRRAVYSGFGENVRKENKFRPLKTKFYLRHKNPRSEKRNRLYKRSAFLLNNFRRRSRVYAKKAARIKQIVSKIIWPFYGDLRIKQMNIIYKKNRRIKSKILTSNEILLNRFENRLDVVVYRLNLAPTILWARRLIENGCVFITPHNNFTLWEFMYASLKKVAFPLKLRDPKKLYAAKLLTHEAKNWALFKFLGRPQKKTSYLLQPGDLIQCLAGNSLHQFKTKSSLWQKPVPKHMLTKTEGQFLWEWHSQDYGSAEFNSWEQTGAHFNAAIFLHHTRFRDLGSKDRVKESFFRWTIL
jgi:ribosomal protein S4